jgi:hypothetical protein
MIFGHNFTALANLGGTYGAQPPVLVYLLYYKQMAPLGQLRLN